MKGRTGPAPGGQRPALPGAGPTPGSWAGGAPSFPRYPWLLSQGGSLQCSTSSRADTEAGLDHSHGRHFRPKQPPFPVG